MSDLRDLLSKKSIWRACDLTDSTSSKSGSGIPTGFKGLDRLLYGRGWPRDALVEVLVDVHGSGELRLLVPGLRHLVSEETRWMAWVNPPFVPYAPALHALHIDIDRILLVHPNSHQEALWALEKILESGCCSAALAWLNEQDLKEKHVRRIQTRAKESNVWTTIFRPSHAAVRSSPAELRLHVQSPRSTSGNRVELAILKRKGGWAVNDVSLRLQWHPDDPPTDWIARRWKSWRQVGKIGETRRIA